MLATGAGLGSDLHERLTGVPVLSRAVLIKTPGSSFPDELIRCHLAHTSRTSNVLYSTGPQWSLANSCAIVTVNVTSTCLRFASGLQ